MKLAQFAKLQLIEDQLKAAIQACAEARDGQRLAYKTAYHLIGISKYVETLAAQVVDDHFKEEVK